MFKLQKEKAFPLNQFCELLGTSKLKKEHLYAILNMVPVGISVSTDITCQEIIHNPMAAEFLRIKPWENLSHSATQPLSLKLLHKGKILDAKDMPIQRAFWNGEEVLELELDFVWEDGVRKTALWSARPMVSETDGIIGAVAAFEDITERRKLEKEAKLYREHLESLVAQRTIELEKAMLELQNSNLKINSVLESITDAFMVVDNQCRVTYINDEAQRLIFGNNGEVLGKNICEFNSDNFGSLFYDEFHKAIIERKSVHLEYLSPVTGLSYEIQAYSISEGLSITFRNITEKKRIETEMNRLDRLNLIGQMAAGIGHEVRNPMTTVRGFLQLLSGKQECVKIKENYSLMINELDRANSIISEFLSLAKNKAVKLEYQSLNSIILSILPLLEADALVSEKFLVTELSELPDLLLDEKEIRQLILNLVRNGLEAMTANGIISIITSTRDNEVFLSIKDTGNGITREMQDKIGTPFVSTKHNGTGIGLAICYSIAERHKAKITFDTGSEGTTFLVKFSKTSGI